MFVSGEFVQTGRVTGRLLDYGGHWDQTRASRQPALWAHRRDTSICRVSTTSADKR